MTMRNEEGKHLLLDPRFLIQVALLLLAAAGFFWKVQYETLENAKDQAQFKAEVSEALSEIKARLPNGEVLEYRLRGLEKRMDVTDARYDGVDAWIRLTREQLIARGLKF